MANKVREWNPIIVREYRARWRGWSAFALLFGYVTVLAIAFFWSYLDATSQSAQSNNPLQRMELLGAQLFLTLIWMQSFAWALIGPAITATSLAGERESGMLEAVQLSPLSPAKIIFGKLGSALSFIALLLLVSLPITATCFLMGGVAPEDFLAALTLHATTAFFGATLGLACSAWSRRANAALRSAYILAIGWLVGSLISFAAAALAPFTGAKTKQSLQIAATLFGWSNPILATASITDKDSLGSATTLLNWGVFEGAPWLISVVFQLVLGATLLFSATRAVRRPFAEQYWLGSASQIGIRNNISASQPINGAAQPQSASSTAMRELHSEWILIPFFWRLSFANPVLQRETRAKFRMRQPPMWVLAFEVLLALFVGYFYLAALRDAVFVPDRREIIWWIIVFVGLTVVSIAAVVSGANAFTRERETQTWEGLRLSLLSPAQIINAKLGATLIGFLVFSLPFWPLLLPCIQWGSANDGNPRNDISPLQAVLSLSIVAATGVCYTLWGMFWSWRCRKTAAAVGWSLGTLFFALVFAPVFLMIGDSSSNNDIRWMFHPFVALALSAEASKLIVSTTAVVFLLLVAAILWLKLRNELQRERS